MGWQNVLVDFDTTGYDLVRVAVVGGGKKLAKLWVYIEDTARDSTVRMLLGTTESGAKNALDETRLRFLAFLEDGGLDRQRGKGLGNAVRTFKAEERGMPLNRHAAQVRGWGRVVDGERSAPLFISTWPCPALNALSAPPPKHRAALK